MKAVVFAYHNVGVRCLRALIGGGVEVALVVTHSDNPKENIWFASVEQVARDYGIPVITPDDPNTPEVLAQVQAAQPDFLFSFYYRHMLKAPLLECPARGAFNMHGSLLPKYRGRVPINWAIIHGETETGATLHVMNVKPDNGPLVDQMAVPILPDDNADEVFAKVTVAAEMVLARSLPALLAGQAEFRQQDLSQGGYFGGRKPEDGRMDPQSGAAQLHNFVRALTHPFPGAFADIDGGRLVIWKTLRAGGHDQQLQTARLHSENGALWLDAVDGGRLKVLSATLDGAALDPATTLTLALA
ncbi:formyltransferase [Chromobacterium haemolyticum]|uniref:Formyltransferase n=1 Tax=Chromobacterium fluminis TaxID=3044269 RepID=A0ABX0L513_9NEIS|nr:formyltransferase [Chromobacterium haemolyticum]NHR06121.1 formyltransferase [Chromobacterium haemolyticum]